MQKQDSIFRIESIQNLWHSCEFQTYFLFRKKNGRIRFGEKPNKSRSNPYISHFNCTDPVYYDAFHFFFRLGGNHPPYRGMQERETALFRDPATPKGEIIHLLPYYHFWFSTIFSNLGYVVILVLIQATISSLGHYDE